MKRKWEDEKRSACFLLSPLVSAVASSMSDRPIHWIGQLHTFSLFSFISLPLLNAQGLTSIDEFLTAALLEATLTGALFLSFPTAPRWPCFLWRTKATIYLKHYVGALCIIKYYIIFTARSLCSHSVNTRPDNQAQSGG